MSNNRYLTKSKFKIGLECPTKLYYTGKKDKYTDQSNDNPFLKALAEGGFQVEELARLYYPGGIAITGDDDNYDLLSSKTNELLKKENVIIYEAAFKYENLFIRADILVKQGNKIKLIEVKAKSIDPSKEDNFSSSRSPLKSDWKAYLYDVAFQKHVIEKSHPEYSVKSFFLLADKTSSASVNGLNQHFKLDAKLKTRTGVIVTKDLNLNDLGERVLIEIPIDEYVSKIHNGDDVKKDEPTFFDKLTEFSQAFADDRKIDSPISNKCKSCQFKDPLNDTKSGHKECWSNKTFWSHRPENEYVYSIAGLQSNKFLKEGIFHMSQLNEDLLKTDQEAMKIGPGERKWLQINKTLQNDKEPFFHLDGLKEEMDNWIYPLNMIDFETSMVAIPFTKGRKPYELICFQFSHHIIYKDGKVEHANEFVYLEPSGFPNFVFVRALKKALESNYGSIFRFAPHENSSLNAVKLQLEESNEHDAEELISFIKSITHSTGKSVEKWTGERDMIDLCEIVKKYYYDPYTEGSNSIKDVLPAVLNSSSFVQEKYSKELQEINVTSKNFNPDKIFLEINSTGEVTNPYKLLPPLFEGWSNEELESTTSGLGDINNGGAALTAYGKLQFTTISQQEKEEVVKGLLRYCELDTLAMVMIFEYFNDIVKKG